jgi:hypothetical protein
LSSSLTPDKRTVVLGLHQADKTEKAAKKKKSELREALFHLATIYSEDQVLAKRTTQLPVGFLNKIGMPENVFIASRWPGWRKVESRKVNDEGEPDSNGEWIEYLLEKDPAYLRYDTEEVEGELTITAGRTIQQNPPEIDQRTLQKDLPEVFDAIMKPHVVYEVDNDKLEALLLENPELIPKIELHLAHPEPIVKLSPIREVKDPDE